MRFRQYRDYENLEVGDKVVLIEELDTNTGEHWYRAVPGEEGIGGNMDHSIKRYHGWRGETNGISRYAHGLREITKIGDEYRNKKGEWFRTISVSPDLKPDAE